MSVLSKHTNKKERKRALSIKVLLKATLRPMAQKIYASTTKYFQQSEKSLTGIKPVNVTINDCAFSVDTKKVEKIVQSNSVQQFLAA